MKKVKNLVAMLLAIVICLSFVACGDSDKKENSTEDKENTSVSDKKDDKENVKEDVKPDDKEDLKPDDQEDLKPDDKEDTEADEKEEVKPNETEDDEENISNGDDVNITGEIKNGVYTNKFAGLKFEIPRDEDYGLYNNDYYDNEEGSYFTVETDSYMLDIEVVKCEDASEYTDEDVLSMHMYYLSREDENASVTKDVHQKNIAGKKYTGVEIELTVTDDGDNAYNVTNVLYVRMVGDYYILISVVTVDSADANAVIGEITAA